MVKGRILLTLLIIPAAVFLGACLLAPGEDPEDTPTPQPTIMPQPTIDRGEPAPAGGGSSNLSGRPRQYSAPPPMTIDTARTYTATITTNRGDMTAELFAVDAPNTVNNFVFLAGEGFYDGVTFHRIIKDFMVQTGDPTGTGSGGPGYRFADEPVNRSYTKGILAMANAGRNTNGSQFFIVHGSDAGLPPAYTIFGQVSGGLQVLDEIANTPVTAAANREVSKPTERVFIERVQINGTP